MLRTAGSLLTTVAVSHDEFVGPRDAAGRATEGPGLQPMCQRVGSMAGGADTGGNGECRRGGGMPAGFLGVQILWEVRHDASSSIICLFCFF